MCYRVVTYRISLILCCIIVSGLKHHYLDNTTPSVFFRACERWTLTGLPLGINYFIHRLYLRIACRRVTVARRCRLSLFDGEEINGFAYRYADLHRECVFIPFLKTAYYYNYYPTN